MTETEQLEYFVHKWPSLALIIYANKLTPEQFADCVRESPAAAREYCADKLTDEQLAYCEDMIND